MDARRRQVYTGIYCFTDHQLEVVEDQMAVPMETMIDKLNQRGEAVTFLGDGVPVFRELIEEKMTVPYSFAPAHVNKQSSITNQENFRQQRSIVRIICVFRRLKESVLSGRRQRPTVIHDVSPNVSRGSGAGRRDRKSPFF